MDMRRREHRATGDNKPHCESTQSAQHQRTLVKIYISRQSSNHHRSAAVKKYEGASQSRDRRRSRRRDGDYRMMSRVGRVAGEWRACHGHPFPVFVKSTYASHRCLSYLSNHAARSKLCSIMGDMDSGDGSMVAAAAVVGVASLLRDARARTMENYLRASERANER